MWLQGQIPSVGPTVDANFKALWPLLVYKIWLTTSEATEAKINKFTRRWLVFLWIYYYYYY